MPPFVLAAVVDYFVAQYFLPAFAAVAIVAVLAALPELFEYIGYYLSHVFGITGKFSHFERVDDLTYRIHIK